MRPLITLLMALVMLVGTAGCPGSESPDLVESVGDLSAERLTVYVVNYPLEYLARRIGGELVEVVYPAPKGVDPAHWSPDAEVVSAYQRADLILLDAAGHGGWVGRASLPRAALVETGAAFADRLIPRESGAIHIHGPGGAHEHAGFETTTWLDPTLAIEEARAIARAFEAARPEHATTFRLSLAELEADLGELDLELRRIAAHLGATPLLFSHPVYPYLTRRYDLNARSLHWEPDQAPDLDELSLALEDHPARWMIWEAEPLEATRQALLEREIVSVVFDPCERPPDEGDLLSVMEANLTRLEAAFVDAGSSGGAS